jgi:hypothetical protein
LVALADGSPTVSSKPAGSEAPGGGGDGNAHLRCPLAEGSLRHKRRWSSLTYAERMHRSCPLETVAHDELSRWQRSRP